MSIDAIKEAITQLPDDERGSLVAWIMEQEYDDWDKEMARDFSPGGRGYHLVDAIDREIEEGKFTSLEQGLESRRKKF